MGKACFIDFCGKNSIFISISSVCVQNRGYVIGWSWFFRWFLVPGYLNLFCPVLKYCVLQPSNTTNALKSTWLASYTRAAFTEKCAVTQCALQRHCWPGNSLCSTMGWEHHAHQERYFCDVLVCAWMCRIRVFEGQHKTPSSQIRSCYSSDTWGKGIFKKTATWPCMQCLH